MVDLKSIRFLVQDHNKHFAFFKVAISSNDASLYIFPYSINGRYYSGISTLPDVYTDSGSHKVDVPFTEQLSAETMPKLSIHERGQIHVDIGNERVGPLWVPNLNEVIDQHVATVTTDNLSGLPEYCKEPVSIPPEIDFIIKTEGEVESIRVLIYVNGFEKSFKHENVILAVGTRGRDHLESPIYFSFYPVAQPNLITEEGGDSGIVIISGWDISKPIGSETDFLFIRGV